MSIYYPYNYQENRIPKYGDLKQNKNNSYYKLERNNHLNSIDNNISTSFSSYNKYNIKNNLDSSLNRSKKRVISRSPCSCGCHSNEDFSYLSDNRCHCLPILHKENYFNHYNSIITKNEEINFNNNDLLNEVINLKRNLKRIENELNRTKKENEACNFYIKELERELSKSNMNNILKEKDNKKRMVNSVKTRDFGRYHDMLNKSFEVLDSISNQCKDPKGKTEGGVNYYYDKNQEYNMVIDTQKKFIDNLPQNLDNYINDNNYTNNIKQYNENNDYNYDINNNRNNKYNNTFSDLNNKKKVNEYNNRNKYDSNNFYGGYNESTIKTNQINSNKFDSFNDDDSKLNVFKYPEGYINIKDINNTKTQSSNNMSDISFPEKKNNNLMNINDNNLDNNISNQKNSYNNVNNSFDNNANNKKNKNRPDRIYKKDNLDNNNKSYSSYPSQIKQKNDSMFNNINNKNPQNPNKQKKGSNNLQKINKSNKINSIPLPTANKAQNKLLPQYNDMNNNKNEEKTRENPINDPILITDQNGNPIYIEGQKLIGMEIVPVVRKDGKEELDENGNIVFLGPDGEKKTQDDLEPIILDNNKPLVNEENKPFLGINGIVMVNRYGNPIVGPGQLYDKNEKVVQGIIGIVPTDNQGNVIKLNMEENPNPNQIDNDETKNINNMNNNNYKDSNNFNNENEPNYNRNLNEDDFNNQYKANNNNANKVNNDTNNVNYNDDNNNKNNYNPENDENENNNNYGKTIKPLIGSDGRPVIDKKNNPIMLDENNKPIKGTGITILLDKSGKPLLNTIGEPILINKEGKPINLIDNKNPINVYYPNNENDNNRGEIPNINNIKRIPNKKMNKYDKNYDRLNYSFNDYENNNNYIYPKINKKYQRKLNYVPKEGKVSNQNKYSSTCFACDVGCAVSRSGYSPMTYSPYNNRIKRREVTPLRNEIY